MEKTKIDHICLAVHDIERSIAWYTSSFNCKVIHQTDKHALLEFENIKLALSLPSLEMPHLAFIREEAEKYGELLEQVDGMLSTYIADPTGNMIELGKKQ